MSDKKNETIIDKIDDSFVELVIPEWVKKTIIYAILIFLVIIIYIIVRWIIGPPGILIDTKKLSGIHKMFYDFINKLKIPKKLVIRN